MKRHFVLPLLLLFLLPAFAALAADQDLIALFMEIDADTTYAEALQMVKDTRLPYSETAYSVDFADDKELSICVANTAEAARQLRPGPGSRLKIGFLKSSGALLSMQFQPYDRKQSALFYVFGTWFLFEETAVPNDYTGLYLVDQERIGINDGIEIRTPDGTLKKTTYFPYEDKTSLIKALNLAP